MAAGVKFICRVAFTESLSGCDQLECCSKRVRESRSVAASVGSVCQDAFTEGLPIVISWSAAVHESQEVRMSLVATGESHFLRRTPDAHGDSQCMSRRIAP